MGYRRHWLVGFIFGWIVAESLGLVCLICVSIRAETRAADNHAWPAAAILDSFDYCAAAVGTAAFGAATSTWDGDGKDINEAKYSRRRTLSCLAIALTSA